MTTAMSNVQVPTIPESLPVAGQDIASLPAKRRHSVKELGQFITEQYTNGLLMRRRHAIAWIMVRSFLRGIHYFTIDGFGRWNPIPKKPGEDREIVLTLLPMYRHVLGFLNSNDLGVTTIPMAGSTKSQYLSSRGEAILNHWIDDANVRSFSDVANQYLLTDGTVGFLRYQDPFRKNVFLKALPGAELFPIPFDAKSPDELHGLIHATVATKQWLELQDRTFEQQTGKPPSRRMGNKATGMSSGMSVNFPNVSVGGTDGKFNGGLVLTTWFRKTEDVETGQYVFMVGDEVFRHAVGTDEQGKSQTEDILDDGEIPVSIVYFDKNPNDFWGTSLCESQIPTQLSLNRQLTTLVRNTRRNRPLTFFSSDNVEMNDISDQESAAIPFKGDSWDPTHRFPPVLHFPAGRVGADVTSLMGFSRDMSDRAAGFRSGIAFGQQEGRTESGPATTLLSQNAMASLNSVFLRLGEAWRQTYVSVLNRLRTVWPEEKTIRMVGPNNVGREIKILRNEIPWSKDLIIRPRPLLAGGRQALLSMLFTLRQMPGEDGKPGTEVSSRELRRSLQEMNMMPPGLDSEDKATTRIQTRINLLIGDGKKPAIAASDPADPKDRLIMEDHRLSIEMLKNTILDDSWETYSPEVQKGLLQQLEFHRNFTFGATDQPGSFDDDVEKQDSIRMERFLEAAEADLETPEGTFDF